MGEVADTMGVGESGDWKALQIHFNDVFSGSTLQNLGCKGVAKTSLDTSEDWAIARQLRTVPDYRR
jgi:hypothetical protein